MFSNKHIKSSCVLPINKEINIDLFIINDETNFQKLIIIQLVGN